MRFSTRPANIVIWDTQLQLGYIWYPFEQYLGWDGGLCAGFMLRQIFWYNNINEYTIYNLTPEILLGWRFKVNSLAFDLRTGWNFASVTWSNMPNTKIASRWTPTIPFSITFTTGVAWMFN
jgi:hypothetical protein